MIDLTKPTWVYDDRSKIDDILQIIDVLWSDAGFVLCRVKIVYPAEEAKQNLNPIDQPLLIQLSDDHVLNTDFDSWYVTNEKITGRFGNPDWPPNSEYLDL